MKVWAFISYVLSQPVLRFLPSILKIILYLKTLFYPQADFRSMKSLAIFMLHKFWKVLIRIKERIFRLPASNIYRENIFKLWYNLLEQFTLVKSPGIPYEARKHKIQLSAASVNTYFRSLQNMVCSLWFSFSRFAIAVGSDKHKLTPHFNTHFHFRVIWNKVGSSTTLGRRRLRDVPVDLEYEVKIITINSDSSSKFGEPKWCSSTLKNKRF